MRLTKPGEVSSLPRSEADTGGAWGLDRKTDLRATFLHPWPVQQLRIDRCSFLSGPSLLLSPARGGRWEGWSLPVSCASHLWDKSSSGGGGGVPRVSAPCRLCLQGGGDLAAGEVPWDVGGIHSLALCLRNVPGLGEGLPKKAGSRWWSHIAVTMGRVPEGSARARQGYRGRRVMLRDLEAVQGVPGTGCGVGAWGGGQQREG